MKTERKTIGATIKQAGDDGSFEAIIATFGVVDKDGDVVEPGAFGPHPVPVLPAHDQGHVPLGKATIEERGDLAIAVGQFNLDIQAGRDWHSALKFDLANIEPAVQEWSWGFRPKQAQPGQVDGIQVRRLIEIDQREVSPVLRGASVGTATLSAKADGGMKLLEQINFTTTEVDATVARVLDAIDARGKRGRDLGGDSKAAAIAMAESCHELDRVMALLRKMAKSLLPEDEAVRAAARFLVADALRVGVDPS